VRDEDDRTTSTNIESNTPLLYLVWVRTYSIYTTAHQGDRRRAYVRYGTYVIAGVCVCVCVQYACVMDGKKTAYQKLSHEKTDQSISYIIISLYESVKMIMCSVFEWQSNH